MNNQNDTEKSQVDYLILNEIHDQLRNMNPKLNVLLAITANSYGSYPRMIISSNQIQCEILVCVEFPYILIFELGSRYNYKELSIYCPKCISDSISAINDLINHFVAKPTSIANVVESID